MYSIGVVTYLKRFETHFKPLVEQLEKIFPDVEKNYVLNGHSNREAQLGYLRDATAFLSRTSARRVLTYEENRPLTKAWNMLLIMSSAPKCLILNDDLVLRREFRYEFERKVEDYSFFLINNSWSHFLIAKSVVAQVGWFEERFHGVGHEDADYGCRMAMLGLEPFRSLRCHGISNLAAWQDNPGWDADTGRIHGKYSLQNYQFFLKKWQWEDSAFPDSIHMAPWGKYAKLRDGMETPQFYDYSLLEGHEEWRVNEVTRFTSQTLAWMDAMARSAVRYLKQFVSRSVKL